MRTDTELRLPFVEAFVAVLLYTAHYVRLLSNYFTDPRLR